MVNLENFIRFHRKLMAFVKPSFSVWHLRILFEAEEDPAFMDYVSDIIDIVTGDSTAHEWENTFKNIRSEIDKFIPKLSVAQTIDEKLNIALRITTLAGLLENLTEDSLLPELVINEFKKQHGNKYLEILQEIDKKYLSQDVQKIRNTQPTRDLPEDDNVRKYLLLKHWQDLQHDLFVNVIWKEMLPIEGAYMKEKGDKYYFPKIIRYTNQNRATKTRAILKLAARNIIHLNDLVVFYLAGLEKEITHLCGGKVIGLVKLRANGIDVPDTYVCPSSCDSLTENDLKILDDKLYAIRSSADCEDGVKHSFAGMFDSFLSIKKADIVEYFTRVKRSVNSVRVKTYIDTNKLSAPHMAVIIQSFVEPTISGVWIGSNTYSGHLEWCNGRGDKLVSGEIMPARETWNTNTTPKKPVIFNGKAIGKICMNIQTQVCGSEPADLEWCIIGDRLVFLQYRHVTAPIITSDCDETTNNKNIISGTSASAGIAEGIARVIQDIDGEYVFNKGDILVTKFTSPEWLPILVKAGGVVTAHGGPLCHTAIIVRELDIPCIVGIGEENLAKIVSGTKIRINGTDGTVSII